MSVETTKLSTLLNRMNRWTSVARNVEEQYLVYDLDEALRNLNRTHQIPWMLKKTTLRVFSDILEYPEAADQLELAFIEGQEDSFEGKPKPYYTSIQEFYEDPTNNSAVAQIWDGNESFLGVRNKNLAGSNQMIDTCELDSGYTLSGDFTAKAIDTVMYAKGNGSLRLSLTAATNLAMVEKTFTGFTDSLYQRKYVFFRVYLSSVPTSINLRVGADSSNYLLKNITTQFSGQAFKANNWNIIAIDLNAPDSTVGTISTATNFVYYGVQLVGAASGLYYLDDVTLKEWRLMDYQYYSFYNVRTILASTPDQRYFMDDDNVYSSDTVLIGPKEFSDVVMYDALTTTLADLENTKVLDTILAKRDKAWAVLLEEYPSMEPLIQIHYWRFGTQMNNHSGIDLTRE